MSRCSIPAVLALVCLSTAAQGADVEFEGFYRARARLFDTLSLDRTLSDSEGMAAYTQHRLWLRPRFVLNENVALYVDFKGLDNVVWGDQVGFTDNPVQAPPALENILNAPTSLDDPEVSLLDFTIWRAWADIHTGAGRFRFGRMPLHWGRGVWQNNGLTVKPFYADYGDTVDRFQWEYLIQDQFFVQAAVDKDFEGFVNAVDDTTSFNGVLAYRSETITTGLNMQLAHTVDKFDDTENTKLNVFTADLALDAELGKLQLGAEFLTHLGGGNLGSGINDVNITSFGGVLDAQLAINKVNIGVEGGFASGDANESDNKFKTFTFDRDYSVGLMLFEQPMPVLQAAAPTAVNGNRDFQSQTLTGNAVSNALYLKPTVAYNILDGLDVHGYWLGARVAKVPDGFDTRKSYGSEFGAGVTYDVIDHFTAGLDAGVFLPGTFYKDYADEQYENFNAAAFGTQLVGTVHF